MEIRIQRIFLGALLVGALTINSSLVLAQEADSEPEEEQSISNVKVFDPQVERREVDRDAIDTENWEIGLQYGVISIEDFGSNEITSFMAAYHVTEDFFLSLNYGESKAGETSFERLSGDVVLLTDEQREYSHYSVALGFNILPGEGFMGRDLAFTSSFYILTGLGSTDFAGDTRSTVMLGGGYQVLFNDWFSMHVMLKDHFYDIELLGSKKTANDLEISTGFTIFF
ncbi:outer membrane beta-barrel domain-containing protein [Aliikangiella coralliicola]|uniref:Outer membrane beta-barrel domain-containing protein n=1 Tax=Aliikangiella coralliicola TaxID=2592383 RepID=A0A545UAT9_9GAMM|nr:outer membrane beta-barrel domain-containing protein [Aliikangiella coralliicola]TQV86580.1 outer membrane beta-barrel domain-containing protein [Aliikangiella coralliicola]